MMKTVFAPFRVSLFGGGADFPSYYKKNPCVGLGLTIVQGAILTFNPNIFYGHKYRLVYSRFEHVDTACEIQHPLIKIIFKKLAVAQGELHYTSDFPSRSGLGTSSAFSVGLLKLLLTEARLRSLQLPDLKDFTGQVLAQSDKISALSIFFERICLDELGGVQDQILCARPGITKITYGPDGWAANRISCQKSWNFIEEHCCLVAIPSEAEIRNGKTSSQLQADNLASGHALEQYRDYVNKMSIVGIESVLSQDLERFAKAIREISKKKNLLASPRSDQNAIALQKKLRDVGALATRVIGAGGGGFLLVVGGKDFIKNLCSKNKMLDVYPLKISRTGPIVLKGV